MQEHAQQGDDNALRRTVRERLQSAYEDLTDAEVRAQGGGDASGGALAASIAAVRLQVTDLLEYADLLEWAASLCAVAVDVRGAIAALSSRDGDAGLAALDAAAIRLSEFSAPSEAGEIHAAFSDALAGASAELRAGEDGVSGAFSADAAIERLRARVYAAADAAPLRTRLAIEQFQEWESLFGTS